MAESSTDRTTIRAAAKGGLWGAGLYVAVSLAAMAFGLSSVAGWAVLALGPAALLGQLITLCSRMHVYGSFPGILAGEVGVWLAMDAITWLMGLMLARRAGAQYGTRTFPRAAIILAIYWVLVGYLNQFLNWL